MKVKIPLMHKVKTLLENFQKVTLKVTNFVAKRYGEFNGQYLIKTWSVLMRDYKELNGIRIPAKGEVIWKLETGDFNWYQLEMTEIKYN